MKVLDLIKARYSVRTFDTKPVSKENLDYILECARLAPSACNKQPWEIKVIQGEALKEFSAVYRKEGFKDAPVCIAVCGNHEQAWHRGDDKDHCDIDIAIVSDHIIMAATELGLGTCWICSFNTDIAKDFLKLEENVEPIVLIPLGYAAEPNREKIRKTTEEIITFIE